MNLRNNVTAVEQDRPLLWAEDYGQISCTRHGGRYLAAAVAEFPSRRVHHTPLGTWRVWSPEDVVFTGLGCESCLTTG